jgi:acyl-CoA thioesterase I
MTYTEIHVWGDSLARGVIYNEEKGRYAISRERCTTRLQQALGCKVENHSVMGATVLDGLQWFDQFRAIPGALCAVEFGGNDCDLDWKYISEHPGESIRAKVELDVYSAGLEKFVQEIRSRDMKPLLVTPLPLHAERYYRWVSRGLDAEVILRALGDVNHIYRWQERYTIAMRNVARSTHCRLLDLRDVFLAQANYEDLMCVDGIHPNDAGHKLLAEAALAIASVDPDISLSLAEREAEEAHATAIPTAARVS